MSLTKLVRPSRGERNKIITIGTALAPSVNFTTPQQSSEAAEYIRNVALADIDMVGEPGKLYLPSGGTFGSSKPDPYKDQKAGQGGVTADKTLPLDLYKAVMHTKLFAQMVARTKYDVNENADKYYKLYVEALGYCGWVQENGEWKKYDNQSSSVKISNAIVDLLKGIIGNKVELFARAMKTLESGHAADPHVKLFGKSKASDEYVNFDVSVVEKNEHNYPVLKPLFFSIRANSGITNILFVDLETSSTKIFYASGTHTLEMDHYNSVKSEIEKQTVEAAKKYIKEFPIGD